jgi:hypothetical protein
MSGLAEGPQQFGVHLVLLWGKTKNRGMKTKALTRGVTSGAATHRGNPAASGGAVSTHL